MCSTCTDVKLCSFVKSQGQAKPVLIVFTVNVVAWMYTTSFYTPATSGIITGHQFRARGFLGSGSITKWCLPPPPPPKSFPGRCAIPKGLKLVISLPPLVPSSPPPSTLSAHAHTHLPLPSHQDMLLSILPTGVVRG